jgi:hypothetical protein
MPSFSEMLDDTQMWQLALLVANADKLPDSAKKILVPDAPAAAMPTTAAKTAPSKK